MLSVVIPSYKDKYLYNTVLSILDNFTGEFEVIPVFDGYEPKTPIVSDSRIRPVYLQENKGMREAINAGIEASKGEHIMRTDEHCMFAKGFDEAILEGMQPNWIVTAVRYFLDPENWAVMDTEPIYYEKLIVKESPKKFASLRWTARTQERRHVMLDENMAMQGSMWVMPRSWWDEVIGRLDSAGYGTHYQDTIEMLFKTWRAGGKLMLNKNTWYAHKHRGFKRTHHYPTRKALPEWQFALDQWKGDYTKVRRLWGM
jgi:glycosyltransferase involved in cell wall biosynthesis